MVSRALRNKGFTVISPPDLHEDNGTEPWEDYLRADIGAMMRCGSILLLPDWIDSRGARKEVQTSIGLGFKYYELRSYERDGGLFEVSESDTTEMLYGANQEDFTEREEESVFEEAQRLVLGPRNDDYGHPFHDFSRTGLIWHAVLRDHYSKSPDEPIPPELVSLCMAGLKISREVNRPKRDNRVDGAGYFGTTQMCAEYRREHDIK